MTDYQAGARVRAHGYRNFGLVPDELFLTPIGARIVTLEEALAEIEQPERDRDKEDEAA